jgi:phosphoribosylformylglycinamidine cyclo-ligase
VDIDAGDALVERIKPHVRRTMRPEVLGGLGGFAGLCALPSGYRNPVLVSGTDGVGTKLKIAFATGRHDTVGEDLVAMCADDVVVTGAEPLFFLDYFATGRLDVGVAERVIAGIAEGCQKAGCALVGGETAELPGFYADGEYDLAGFCVGVVERDGMWGGARVQLGDRIVGLASSGLHSNGYSLARRVIERMGLGWDDRPDILGGASVGDALIAPTRIYARSLLALAKAVPVHGAAHITGGGLVENSQRMLDDSAGFGIRLDGGAWKVPPVFELLREGGAIDKSEMRRTFNMGIGMVVAVAPSDVKAAVDALGAAGEQAWVIGEVVRRGPDAPEVEITGSSI